MALIDSLDLDDINICQIYESYGLASSPQVALIDSLDLDDINIYQIYESYGLASSFKQNGLLHWIWTILIFYQIIIVLWARKLAQAVLIDSLDLDDINILTNNCRLVGSQACPSGMIASLDLDDINIYWIIVVLWARKLVQAALIASLDLDDINIYQIYVSDGLASSPKRHWLLHWIWTILIFTKFMCLMGSQARPSTIVLHLIWTILIFTKFMCLMGSQARPKRH